MPMGHRSQAAVLVGMSLDMLLEILWALAGLATELALVRIERNMDSNVRSGISDRLITVSIRRNFPKALSHTTKWSHRWPACGARRWQS